MKIPQNIKDHIVAIFELMPLRDRKLLKPQILEIFEFLEISDEKLATIFRDKRLLPPGAERKVYVKKGIKRRYTLEIRGQTDPWEVTIKEAAEQLNKTPQALRVGLGKGKGQYSVLIGEHDIWTLRTVDPIADGT